MCIWPMSIWSSRRYVFTLWCFRGVTLASLESYHGYWSRTVHHFSIWWGIDTFKKYDFHDETTKSNTCSCCWSSCGLPNGLEDVGTYINWGSCNKITQELSFSKIDESSVGQRVEIGEHDQLQCGQLSTNFAVFIDVPLLETSWLGPRTCRISWTLGVRSS